MAAALPADVIVVVVSQQPGRGDNEWLGEGID